jgi:hypothetical protein
MKGSAIILLLGVALGAVAYGGFYFAGTAAQREMLESPVPELAWLKKEFNLGDAEFARVEQLHEGFKAECMEICRRIDLKNAELKELLAKADALTPEIQAKLSEAGQLRTQCQENMLRHFFAVSRSMPPDQGKRYLAWVQAKTFLPEHRMHETGSAPESMHEDGHR